MKIGISGTIGSGKSEFCNYLRSLGYDVFDCDEVNRKLLEEDNIGYIEVCKAFPEAVIDDKLDKTKLSEIVFSDEKERLRLESIMHPLILNEMMKREDDPLFAEVPLLFECDWDRYFDMNVLVVSDRDIIIDRLLHRGLTMKDIEGRMAAQMSVEEKINRADKIIYNNGSLNDMYDNIDYLLSEIL